jgi:hypothetical protein
MVVRRSSGSRSLTLGTDKAYDMRDAVHEIGDAQRTLLVMGDYLPTRLQSQ